MKPLKEWRSVALSDNILSQEQIKEVTRILNSKSDPLDTVHELKVYLRKFSDELAAKEVLPDYLAYWLVYAATVKL